MPMRRATTRRLAAHAIALAAALVCITGPISGCGGQKEYVRTERRVSRPSATTTVVEEKTTVIKETRPREKATVWYTICAPFRWLSDLLGITLI